MPKPTNMEIQAIKSISSKKTREEVKKLGFRSTFILSMYHKTGRKGKYFDDAFLETLKDSEKVLKQIDKVIEMSKRQIEHYNKLKESIIYHNMKKLMEENHGKNKERDNTNI